MPGNGVALLCERELRALIFDMDGTLFDSASVVPDAYIETVLACGGGAATSARRSKWSWAATRSPRPKPDPAGSGSSVSANTEKCRSVNTEICRS